MALGVDAIVYYLVQYLFTSLACFFVLAALIKGGHGLQLADLAGLSRRSPLLAWALVAAMLSMAGIPPLSGFMAKYMVFAAVPDYSAFGPLYFTVLALALVGVVVSVVYYFSVIRAMWEDDTRCDTATRSPTAGPVLGGALTVCVGVMLVLGVYQGPLLDAIGGASASLGLAVPEAAPPAEAAAQK